MKAENPVHRLARSLQSANLSPLKLTLDDADRLGKCYESWDDSDSWPGGFTQGVPQVAERVLENLKKWSPLQRRVVRVGDKIVGYADVFPDFHEDDSVYVGLLGVNPQYQNRGYGKALLLDATEFALSLGKMRITLGTWGGNLKAMPLYKRQGYFWVPDTTVHMENYIPGIVGCPYFQEFFKRFEWYSSLRRKITQKPDELIIDGMNVFEYHFVGDDKNELRVWIDREGKGIHAFHWIKDGQHMGYSIRCQVPTHEAYIGYANVPLVITIENELTEPLNVQLKADGTDGVSVSIGPETIVVPPGDSQAVHGRVSVSLDAQETDRERERDIKARTRVTAKLVVNGQPLELTCGLLARKPVQLHLFPPFSSLRPERSDEFLVAVRNNTIHSLQVLVDLVLTLNNDQIIELPSRTLDLDQKAEAIIKSQVDLSDFSVSQTAQLQANLRIKREEEIIELPHDSVPVAIVGESGVVAYSLRKHELILENTVTRLVLDGRPPHGIKSITYKTEQISLATGRMWIDDIGLPFQGGLSEFTTREYDIQLESKNGQQARVIFNTICEKKAGLEFSRIITLPANSAAFTIHYEFRNSSDNKIKDIAFALHGGWWMNDLLDGRLFLPFKNGFRVHERMEYISMEELPSDSKQFAESWVAIESQDRWVVGVIWDESYAMKILTGRVNIPRVEVRVPNLGPKESHKTSKIIAYIGSGSWKTIRGMWKEQYRSDSRQVKTLQEVHNPVGIPTTLLTMASTNQPKDIPFAVFPPEEEYSGELRLENISRRPLAGILSLSLPLDVSSEGTKEWEIRDVKEDVWTGHFPIRLARSGVFEIEAELQTDDFRLDESFLLISGLPNNPVQVETHARQNGFTRFTVKNGFLEFSASPEFCGAMTSLRRIDKAEIASEFLFSRFPELHEYAWFNVAPLGVNISILGPREWSDDPFCKEVFAGGPSQDGHWHGLRFKAKLKESPTISGLEVTVSYMTVAEAPIVRISVSIFNPTSRPIESKFKINVYSALVPKKTFYYSRDGQVQNHISSKAEASVSSAENWIAIEFPEVKEFLGVIQSPDLRTSLYLYDGGEKYDIVGIEQEIKFLPQDNITLDLYLLIADSVNQIQNAARNFRIVS